MLRHSTTKPTIVPLSCLFSHTISTNSYCISTATPEEMTLEPLTMAHLLFAGMAIDSVGEQLATIEGFRYFQWSMVP